MKHYRSVTGLALAFITATALVPPLSLIALVEGFGTAIFVGIAVGVSMGLSWRVKAVLDPYVNAFLAAPSAAFVPLMVVFFGLGRGPVAATIFIFTCFNITHIISTNTLNIFRTIFYIFIGSINIFLNIFILSIFFSHPFM